MQFTTNDLIQMLPLIILGGAILVALIIEMYVKNSKAIVGWFSVAALLITGYLSLFTVNTQTVLFNGMLAVGGNVHIFYFLFNFTAAIVVMISLGYIKKADINFGEYYIMLLSAVLGMMMLAGARDLIMVFIGLEQMSICFYILAGFRRKNLKSNEAALKYFLLGSFTTGFIVYGMALIYGSLQSLSIDSIILSFPDQIKNPVFVAGVLLFIIGFTFKIAAVPFHMWVPDVYQGAPTTVSAFLSTTGKAAAFSALILIFTPVLVNRINFFAPFISTLAVLSMVYGSVVALVQNDIKRMLAYSSIAHAGYMLIGLAAGNSEGSAGIIFYLVAYSFMNLGAFGIISMIESTDEKYLSIEDYSGFSNQNPLLAALLSIFMFSLSGIPPFAGFFGKYYVFISAIKANMTWLAIVGVLSSVVSVYFYLRIIVLMYFKKSETTLQFEESNTGLLGIVVSAMLVVVIGLAPGSIIDLISSFIP